MTENSLHADLCAVVFAYYEPYETSDYIVQVDSISASPQAALDSIRNDPLFYPNWQIVEHLPDPDDDGRYRIGVSIPLERMLGSPEPENFIHSYLYVVPISLDTRLFPSVLFALESELNTELERR